MSILNYSLSRARDFRARFYTFRIVPFGSPKIRTVKKAQKIYFWDWSEVENEGAKFENLVASQLLKYCHFLGDAEGEKMELRFLRDPEGREIDFIVLKNKKPLFAVECKTGEKNVSKSLLYFKERIAIPKYFQVQLGKSDFLSKEGLRVLPYLKFCLELNLP